MEALQITGKLSLKTINPFLLLKHLVAFLILSISVSIQNASAAEEIYTVEGPASDKIPYIRLRNIITHDILYLPIKNFTVADYGLLKKIKFKLSKIDPTSLDTLQIQALYYGAGWINNVNQTSTGKIMALKHAVSENIGIWFPGYLKKHVHQETYIALKASLRRIHILLKYDSSLSKSNKKNDIRLAHNKPKKLHKSRPSDGCKVTQKEHAIVPTTSADSSDTSTNKTGGVIEGSIFDTSLPIFVERAKNWIGESYGNFGTVLAIIISLIALVFTALPFFGIKRFRINIGAITERRTNARIDREMERLNRAHRTVQHNEDFMRRYL